MVEAGKAASQGQLALDIKYNEVISFLKARNKLTEKWQATLRAVQHRAGKCIEELPGEYLEGTNLAGCIRSADVAAGAQAGVVGAEAVTGPAAVGGGEGPSFVDCLAIFQRLKEREGEDLNMFRQYKSERVQTWYKLVTLFRRDGVCLGEMGTLMNKNTTYEIPALRSERQRLYQQSTELQRKAADQKRKADDFRSAFASECKKIGISPPPAPAASNRAADDGARLRAELRSLTRGLDDVYSNIGTALTDERFSAAMSFYDAFISNVHNAKKRVADRMPLSTHLASNGLGTISDFLNTLGIEDRAPPLADGDVDGLGGGGVDTEASSAPAVSIDWGEDDATITPGSAAEASEVQMVGICDDEGLPTLSLPGQDGAPDIDLDFEDDGLGGFGEGGIDIGGSGEGDDHGLPTLSLPGENGAPQLDLDFEFDDAGDGATASVGLGGHPEGAETKDGVEGGPDDLPTLSLPGQDGAPTLDLDFSDDDDDAATAGFQIEACFDATNEGVDEHGAGADFGDFEISIEGRGDNESSESVLRELAQAINGMRGGLLEAIEVRNQLLNEIAELLAFLERRLIEIEIDDETSRQLQAVMPSNNTSSDVSAYLSVVQDVHARLTSSHTQQLFMLKTSAKHVERVAASLEKRLALAKRMDTASTATYKRCSELESNAAALGPRIDRLVAETRQVQEVAQRELSILHKGREVNIIGAINEL